MIHFTYLIFYLEIVSGKKITELHAFDNSHMKLPNFSGTPITNEVYFNEKESKK